MKVATIKEESEYGDMVRPRWRRVVEIWQTVNAAAAQRANVGNGNTTW